MVPVSDGGGRRPTSWSCEIVEVEMPSIKVVDFKGRGRLINAHLIVLEAAPLPGKPPQLKVEVLLGGELNLVTG